MEAAEKLSESVIVPVYQCEHYIDQCIRSILAQTFTDFELLLVLDGSVDSSPHICRDYARKDGRIKVIEQENQGGSAARNNGIEHAMGKYLCFVDSDDWIEPNFLENWLTMQRKLKATLCCALTMPKPVKEESLSIIFAFVKRGSAKKTNYPCVRTVCVPISKQ